MIGFKVKNNFYPIGTTEFLESFFYTIQYHLCGDKWGDKYQLIMKDLYSGKLKVSDVPEAKKQLCEIRDKLSNYPPSKVVWDIKDLSKRPPWGDDINADITDLSNYFVTNDGKDLFDVMLKVFSKSLELQWDVLIWNMFIRPDKQPKADQSR